MLEQGGGGRMPAPRSAHPAEAAPPRAPAPSPSYDPMPSYDPIEDLPPPPPPPAPRPRLPGFGAPPAPPSAPAAAAEPNAGQRGWRPPGTRQAAPAPIEPPVRQEPTIGVPERTARPAAQEPSFDTIWPSDRRAERIEPQPDLPPEPAAAPAPPRLNGDATHREPPPARPAAETVPVSVLKSGVVDGMAYTLYTDGSIEAELAQGVVRFGSIEELRNHLEKGA
jgi:hypothetical protein